MALRNEEIIRCKLELGYNVTGVGAEPYINYIAVFDKAVQPYLIDLGSTSATTVVAAPGGAVTTITVADNPPSPGTVLAQLNAFVQGSAIVVDVGTVQEETVIQSISGLAITCILTNAHSGTYPVLLEGAEQGIRDILTRLTSIKNQIACVAPFTAGIEQSDEVRLYGGGHASKSRGRNVIDDLLYQRTVARRDLAAAIGVPYLTDIRSSAGGSFEVY